MIIKVIDFGKKSISKDVTVNWYLDQWFTVMETNFKRSEVVSK